RHRTLLGTDLGPTFYRSSTILGDKRLRVLRRDSSHESKSGKPYPRAGLRNLDRPWLHARPSRAALACGRTGSVGDIDGRAGRQTKSEEEATVVRRFEDPQDARDGWLTPEISPEMQAPVRRRSSRKAATTLADSPDDQQLPEESYHGHRRLLRSIGSRAGSP